MNRDLTDFVDVDVELARFIRRVRVQSLRRLEEIDPRLDYGSFLFLLMIVDATGGIRGSELAEALANIGGAPQGGHGAGGGDQGGGSTLKL